MKKMIAAAGMMMAIVMASPVQAGPKFNTNGSFQVADAGFRWYMDGYDKSGSYTNQKTILPLRQVAKIVSNNGQRKITDIRLHSSHAYYTVKFVNAKGKYKSAKARAHNGKLYERTLLKANAPDRLDRIATVFNVTKKARSKGLRHIDKVDWQPAKDRFVVRGLNKNGKPTKLAIGPGGNRVYDRAPANNYNGPNYVRYQDRPWSYWESRLENKYDYVGPAVTYSDAYVVLARTKNGKPVEIVVDRYSGKVLQRNVLRY